MSRISIIAAGVLATVCASLFGLVLVPDWQLKQIKPVEITAADGSVAVYPSKLAVFREAPGKEVYRALGCIYCHSQQVRPKDFGADIQRGWGSRRSVPRDYLLQEPPLLGTMRTGPDLANIGVRQPSDQWHYLHLYDPQITSPGSVMPPFKFLFESHTGTRPQKKLGVPIYQLPDSYSDEPTWIAPTERAMQLVAYLEALKQPHSLRQVE